MKTINTIQMLYPVVETFYSVQGEGYWAGTSAFFIRLAGCDVGCWFCDTKESWNAKRHAQQSASELAIAAQQSHPAITVVTGGEPLMHDLTALTTEGYQRGLQLHLETSGSHPFSGRFDWVTLSPKSSKPPHASVYPHVHELKVVVADPADFEWAEQQAQRVSPSTVLFLQPEWSTPESHAWIVDYVLSHPKWRISLQTHKVLGVR